MNPGYNPRDNIWLRLGIKIFLWGFKNKKTKCLSNPSLTYTNQKLQLALFIKFWNDHVLQTKATLQLKKRSTSVLSPLGWSIYSWRTLQFIQKISNTLLKWQYTVADWHTENNLHARMTRLFSFLLLLLTGRNLVK